MKIFKNIYLIKESDLIVSLSNHSSKDTLSTIRCIISFPILYSKNYSLSSSSHRLVIEDFPYLLILFKDLLQDHCGIVNIALRI
jgi:hypothetical protein